MGSAGEGVRWPGALSAFWSMVVFLMFVGFATGFDWRWVFPAAAFWWALLFGTAVLRGRSPAVEASSTPACLHGSAVPVELAAGGERVAWLCPDCDEQLPADWAPRLPDPNRAIVQALQAKLAAPPVVNRTLARSLPDEVVARVLGALQGLANADGVRIEVRKRPVDPHDAPRERAELGVDTFADAQLWRKHGFTPQRAKAWIQNGFCDPQAIAATGFRWPNDLRAAQGMPLWDGEARDESAFRPDV